MATSPDYSAMSKDDLIAIIESQKLSINFEREKRKWYEQVLANKDLPINLRLATIAAKKLAETSKPGEDGFYRVHLPNLANEVGVSPSTISRGLRNLADCTEAIEHDTKPKADEPYKDIVFIRPGDLLDRPQDIKPIKEIKRHGGDHRIICNACGSDDVIEQKKHVCRSCGNVVKLFEDRSLNEPLQDAMGIVEQEESEIISDLPDSEEIEPLQDATFTTPITTQYACISVEEWLQHRIGHGPVIVSTGSVENTDEHPKYYTKPAEYVPDIKAYVRGDLKHIYGSRPALLDGTTYLLGFDIEDPALDKSHKYMMFRLALAGIASVYWKRRPGRGHLEVYTDVPVDRKAFYAHLVRVCPDLAQVPEVFPIGSDQNANGDDRSDYGYSWPLYYRIDNQVIECSAEFMFPDQPGELVHSNGYKSDHAGLEHLLSRVIMPSAIIPDMPVQAKKEPTKQTQNDVLLLEKPLNRSFREGDDLMPIVLDEWNRTHSWDEVIALCGGIQKNKHFPAVWRGERTASVKVDPDGRYARDYGKSGDFPKKLDKFGVYCLAQGLDQKQEINRLCAEYRQLSRQERRAS